MSAFKYIALNADLTSPAVAVGMSGWSIDWAGSPFQNIPTLTLGNVSTLGQLILTHGAFQAFFEASLISANRTIRIPDVSGTLALSGASTTTAYVAKTANYTVTAADGTINCTSGTFTVTLLTAVGIVGQKFDIKNSGSGVITLATTSSQTIDGNLTLTLGPGVSVTVQSTNAVWILI